MDGGGGEGEEEDYSLEGLSFEGESHSIITSGNSVDMSSMTNNVRVTLTTWCADTRCTRTGMLLGEWLGVSCGVL